MNQENILPNFRNTSGIAKFAVVTFDQCILLLKEVMDFADPESEVFLCRSTALSLQGTQTHRRQNPAHSTWKWVFSETVGPLYFGAKVPGITVNWIRDRTMLTASQDSVVRKKYSVPEGNWTSDVQPVATLLIFPGLCNAEKRDFPYRSNVRHPYCTPFAYC